MTRTCAADTRGHRVEEFLSPRGAHGFDADTLHPGGADCADAFAIGELEHGTPPSAPTSIDSPCEAGRYGVNRGSWVIVSVCCVSGNGLGA